MEESFDLSFGRQGEWATANFEHRFFPFLFYTSFMYLVRVLMWEIFDGLVIKKLGAQVEEMHDHQRC